MSDLLKTAAAPHGDVDQILQRQARGDDIREQAAPVRTHGQPCAARSGIKRCGAAV